MCDVMEHLLSLGCYGSFGYFSTTEALQAGTEQHSEAHSGVLRTKCTRGQLSGCTPAAWPPRGAGPRAVLASSILPGGGSIRLILPCAGFPAAAAPWQLGTVQKHHCAAAATPDRRRPGLQLCRTRAGTCSATAGFPRTDWPSCSGAAHCPPPLHAVSPL